MMDDSLVNSYIIAVDDDEANLKILRKMLAAQGYTRITTLTDPREVMPLYRKECPDLILLDLNMPYLSGFDILYLLAEERNEPAPPVIVITAQQREDALVRALSGGATDFITKPIDRTEVLLRIKNTLTSHIARRQGIKQNENLERLVDFRTADLRNTRRQIVTALGRAGEFRDNDTGRHVVRVGNYSKCLAKSLGWNDVLCELISQAAQLHDVGKIGIPDRILLKPGRLDEAEMEIMKTHTTIGSVILEEGDSDLLRLARLIALSHHEKWDGTGYPGHLAGKDIPQPGRIVALADTFDALISPRVYKPKWSIETILDYVSASNGSQFDPEVVEAFRNCVPEFLAIFNDLSDD